MNPEIYEWQSAPWYTNIEVFGCLIVLFIQIIQLFIKKNINHKKT